MLDVQAICQYLIFKIFSGEILMDDINSTENSPKCPMGKHPWLATIVLLAFLALLAGKLMGMM